MNVYNSAIDSKKLKELSVLQPWRTVAALVMDWVVIAGAIAVSVYADSWLVYFVAIALIAGRMHAFGVLMHEAAHYRFLKDRRTAEWVMDIFAAWPIMATVDGYRQNHLAHHQHTNTEDDPDWMAKLGTMAFTFPQKVRNAIVTLFGYLVAVNSIRDILQILPRINKNDRSTLFYKFARVGFYVVSALVITWLDIWNGVVLYWIVPFLTLFFLFVYVRSVAEHFGSMDYDDELGSTRTVAPYFWERWFFAPHNINYHLEHHLYPGVPFYNLPRLHEALMADSTYKARAHMTRGYSTGVVRECLA